ncbi:Pre-mRNA-splicing factor cwc21 [Senna tora]|uniref:Pre-mRNA-splicing factor cwc21 n=1 Tax=Senna tora TaxID=362788 RepID=A0A834T8S0_9FABA|nr:Pre-mRNA-splicing factor cwc21 [Senna tora]
MIILFPYYQILLCDEYMFTSILSRHGSITFLCSCLGFQLLASLFDFLCNLSISVPLINEFIFENHQLELNLTLTVMLKDLFVRLPSNTCSTLICLKTSCVFSNLGGLGLDKELVALDVSIRPRSPWGL